MLHTYYGSNQGSPLRSVIEALRDFYAVMPAGCHIAGAVTTGYGEAIVKAALHADGGEVETFAHLRAAQEFCPEVSFVLDIGGQDMKCFFVQNGSVGNITLNGGLRLLHPELCRGAAHDAGGVRGQGD